MALRSVYFNGNLERPFNLEESDSMFVIRLLKEIDSEAFFKSHPSIAKVFPDVELIASFPRSNVHIYKCISEEKGVRDTIKLAIREVADSEVLSYVGSVFQFANTQIYQIYTSNIFIKFYDAISENFITTLFKAKNLVVKKKLDFGTNVYFIESNEDLGREIFDFCRDLLAMNEVECCHPELVTKLHPTTKNSVLKDTASQGLPKEWWLNRTGVFHAWEKTRGKGTTIAIIDDGIELRHEAFKNRIVAPRDMLDKTATKFPHHVFTEGHGTACASVAASSDANSWGVAPEAAIMPIKITGIGSVLQSDAIYWAVHHNADVISCSWGPPDGSILTTKDDTFEFPLPDHTRLAFEYASKYGRNGKGCTIVFAAGNGREPVKYDGYASSKDVLAVSSINHNDKPSIFSDYGAPVLCSFPGGDYSLNSKNLPIDITGLYVAKRIGKQGYSADDHYSIFTGTSASCPGVAGTVALMYAINPNLGKQELRSLLISSCEKAGPSTEYDNKGYGDNFGFGLLRADLAVANTIEFTKKTKDMATLKKSAVSLHIGINNVDTNFYKGYVPPLLGCVNDMQRMGDLAFKIGYETHFLQDNEATREAIKDKIIFLGNTVEEEGILLITYAGHGAPIPDVDGDEADGADEAWVAFDGFLLDDELHSCTGQISSKIRVVTVSDSCHSESQFRAMMSFDELMSQKLTRAIPLAATQAILKANNITARSLRSAVDKSMKDGGEAFVISMAACEENEKAQEARGEGLFTNQLLKTYSEFAETEEIDYPDFIDVIREKMDQDSQHPRITYSHKQSNSFKSQFPLSIVKISLAQNESKTKTKPLKKPIPSGNGSTSESDKFYTSALFLDAESLIIETDDEVDLTVTKDVSTRSIKRNKNLKITNGIVDARDLKGQTDWNKAYNLLLANPDKNIKSIEPETVSNMYHIPRLEEGSRSAGDYLSTYPNPEQFNDPNPFVWHLDDVHSQLKSANEAVFPEIKMGKPNTTQKDIVKIGHIDTGFVENHPSLPVNMDPAHVRISKGKAKKGAVDTDKKISVAEQQGHGTATMSILAGNWVDLEETEGNYKGFFGAIPYAKVLTIKVSETVALLSGRNFAKAVDYAVDQGCDVITMSMAGLPSKVMAKAVNRAYEHGVVIVSAASNSFSEGAKKLLPKRTLYPARYDRVVSATGVAYNHKPYLNRYHDGSRAAGGLHMQTCYGPDYVLPTSIAGYTPNISWFDQITPNVDGSTTYYLRSGGGTSSATPQVAAGAAIYIQKYKKELSKFQGKDAWKKAEIVRQALFHSADKSTAYNFVYGTGIMRANNALLPKFAPVKMITSIEKAEKAPEKRRFLGGLFGVFGNRSIMVGDDSMQEKLEDMMVTEICQLLHKDEKLFKYLDELNLETADFNISENNELIKDILKSPFASDFLKQHLFSVPSENRKETEMSNNDHNNIMLTDATGSLSIRATNVAYTVSHRKSYQETFENNSVWVDQFEMQVRNSRGFRTNLDSKMEIGVESHLEDINSVMLIEKVYEEGTIYEWKFPDEFGATVKRNIGKVDGNSNFYSFKISEFTDSERGFIDKLKRIGVKVFKWIKPDVSVKSKLLDKVIARFGENKYEIKVFDLKGEDTLSADGWMDIDMLDKNKTYAAIQKDKKPVLVLMPGLFNSVESGFNVFLEIPSVKRELLKTHGRYVLGCNMPTLVQGIEANANRINELLKGNLKGKECNVLARSRGGVVARYLFEDTWINNKTLHPTTSAPLVLNKLIMFGTPNQGTMMASSGNWKSLLNYTTNICMLALGTIVPVVPKLLSISKAMALGVVNLPGIDDLEESSAVLLRLNGLKANRKNYFVFTSNYEPNRKLLKRLFDEFLVDRAIFKRQFNDSVTPVDGAIFKNVAQKNDVELKDDQFYIASAKETVSHFGYLHPRHPLLIEKLWEVL